MSRSEKSMSSPRQAIAIIVLLPIIIPLALTVLLVSYLNRAALYLLIWVLWLPKGKDTLVICSNSPIWQDYMSQEILPLLRERAVILNWSERKRWPRWSLANRVFLCFAGDRAFNPMVLVFRPFQRAAVFRFWQAFNDWKHGNPKSVEQLRKALAFKLSSRMES
jgi:hypothetical protein